LHSNKNDVIDALLL